MNLHSLTCLIQTTFQDYDPTKDGSGEVVSEEDGSGDDEDGPGTKKKGPKAKKGSKRKQRANEEKLGKRPGGILFVEDDEVLKAEEERKKEFELEKVEKKEEDEKKKLDDLWAGKFLPRICKYPL